MRSRPPTTASSSSSPSSAPWATTATAAGRGAGTASGGKRRMRPRKLILPLSADVGIGAAGHLLQVVLVQLLAHGGQHDQRVQLPRPLHEADAVVVRQDHPER